jgi:hypothetical protein
MVTSAHGPGGLRRGSAFGELVRPPHGRRVAARGRTVTVGSGPCRVHQATGSSTPGQVAMIDAIKFLVEPYRCSHGRSHTL